MVIQSILTDAVPLRGILRISMVFLLAVIKIKALKSIVRLVILCQKTCAFYQIICKDRLYDGRLLRIRLFLCGNDLFHFLKDLSLSLSRRKVNLRLLP